MSLLRNFQEKSYQAWRYVGAGLLGYAALSGVQALNNIPVKHSDQVLLQQAYTQGDRYLQGVDQQKVNGDVELIEWEGVTAGITAVGGAASILILGRRSRSSLENIAYQQAIE